MMKKKYCLVILFGFFFFATVCMLQSVSAGEPEPYITVSPPSESFGTKERIEIVNSSYFWELMDNNTVWYLEGKHPATGEWTYTNESLTVERERYTSYEKVTLNFTSPYTTRYRLTYAFKLDAVSYINQSTYEIGMNLSIPGTNDSYPVVFNWSDVKPMIQNGNVIQKHGIKNVDGENWFWFRLITVNNVQQGNTVLIDPYFGYSGTSNSLVGLTNYVVGSNYYCPYESVGENITVLLRDQIASWGGTIKCALYHYGNLSLVTNGVTEEKSIPNKGNGVTNWYTFNFTGTKPVLNPGYYLVTVFGNNSCDFAVVVNTSGTQNRLSDSETYGAFPDPFTVDFNNTNQNVSIYCVYNRTPVLSNPNPSDGDTSVSTSISQVSVTINDPEGDTFNWSIETSPNIGSNSATGANNGSKTCSVSGLVNGTTYTWYVNVTDSAGNVVNQTYTFTVYGAVEFWCYDESEPSLSIPFGLQISNQQGTDTYQNNSLTSGDTISTSELPSGDDVIFVVNSSGYETRTYTYDIQQNTVYNFSFYLPPESDTDVLKTNSSAVTDHTSNTVINLECEPRMILLVQGWNNSIYGGWFTIGEANYTLSGTTITVSSDVLDANTTLVQAQYYCDNDVLDYIIHVINNQNNPVNNARINVSFMYDGSYYSVSSALTDGNGDATFYLIPSVPYLLTVTADSYETEYVPYTFTESVRTKTILLTYESDFNVTYDFWDLIDFNATMNTNNSIEVTFVDSNSSTTSATFYTYEIYNDSSVLNATNSTTSNSFTFWVTGINTSRIHQIRLVLVHETLGNVNISIYVGPIRTLLEDINAVELIFANILGNWSTNDGGLGYVNFFFFFLPSVGLVAVSARKNHPGFGIICAAGYLAFAGSIVFDNVFISAPFIGAIGVALMAVKGGFVRL